MDDKERIEQGKFSIQRYDHYYDTVNNKSAFFIGLNTFILGGICTGYVTLYKEIAFTSWLYFFTGVHLACCLGSILYTLLAMTPFTKDKYSNDNSTSLLFFGGVAKHTHSHFHQKFLLLDEPTFLEDITKQIHCLSKGLDQKFSRLKIASYFLISQFTLLIPFIYLLIKNLK